MELVIYTPQEDQFVKEITFNHEEIKAELAQQLKKYQGLVYGEDSIREAKADRATLNKFKTAIEDKRKEIKNACLEPYNAFEAKIKEIVAMIDKPIAEIDSQVKNFEQIKKDEKLQAIKQFYTDKAADLEKLVPFDRIFNQKWLNVTYKEADIQKEITDLFIKVESDLQVITELQTEYEPQLKDFYLKNYDLTATLQEKKRLEEQAAKLAEYKRQQEEKKRQALKQVEPAQEPKTVANPEPAKEIAPTPQPQPQKQTQLFTVDFRVIATAEQLNALKQFLVTNGIKYGKVPTGEPERKAM